VVLTGQDPILQDAAVDAAHQVGVAVFRDFWQADDPYAAPVRAAPLRADQVRGPAAQPASDTNTSGLAPTRQYDHAVPLPTLDSPPEPAPRRPPAVPGPVSHGSVPPHRPGWLPWLMIVVVAVLAIVVFLVVR
jgi:hypothetical protein